MREFLRRCPSSGRRFVVRIKSKKLTDLQHETERVIHDIVTVRPDGRGGGRLYAPANAATVDEIPVERETFDVVYECRHCNHKWTETVTAIEKG